MKARWSWKRWQNLVSSSIEDADAQKLAEVWPAFARNQGGKRGMWAHEMTYEFLKGWEMRRVMRAANVLETHGLSSRCPGTPLYVPTIPEQEQHETLVEAQRQ